jgi:hypothetical protein
LPTHLAHVLRVLLHELREALQVRGSHADTAATWQAHRPLALLASQPQQAAQVAAAHAAQPQQQQQQHHNGQHNGQHQVLCRGAGVAVSCAREHQAGVTRSHALQALQGGWQVGGYGV